MHDANLIRVLGAQSRRKITSVGLRPCDAAQRRSRTRWPPAARTAAHVIVDVTEDADLHALGEALDGRRLITGGAGIAIGLPAVYRRHGWLRTHVNAVAQPVCGGRAAVIAGSASEATRAQVADFRAGGAPVFAIGSEHITDPPGAIARILQWAGGFTDRPILVSASASPEIVRDNEHRFGATLAGQRVETILAGVASGLVEAGVRRLVVAGGETSGAVVGALGATSLRIGPRIDVGVPWTVVDATPRLGLALKSGNFGGPDFFSRALAMTA